MSYCFRLLSVHWAPPQGIICFSVGVSSLFIGLVYKQIRWILPKLSKSLLSTKHFIIKSTLTCDTTLSIRAIAITKTTSSCNVNNGEGCREWHLTKTNTSSLIRNMVGSHHHHHHVWRYTRTHVAAVMSNACVEITWLSWNTWGNICHQPAIAMSLFSGIGVRYMQT